ncbi:uncharacterized protein [Antedon mediterranea]|uniref:uncharacterized protein n=1 Tax=Antedon mediterranea TaxID=105859 RepID=UPI003AF8A3BF
MVSLIQPIIIIQLFLLISVASKNNNRRILVDVTSNKLTREHDGSFGMWSYHGIAKESHAKPKEFIFNGDLVDKEGRHKHIASTLYPTLGLTSDQDPVYQEYLILQSQLVGVDGFLVEWGYKGHSSDVALQSYRSLAKKHKSFVLGVNWCDHWLYDSLKNRTRSEILDAFHDNLQYLMDTLFLGPDVSVFNNKNPVIFLFGRGITSDILRDLISMPLDLKEGVDKPIWIGSYLNFASGNKWDEWADLLNGTFGWVPPRTTPTPSDMPEWDFYASLKDVTTYHETLNNFGSDCLKKDECQLWLGSASPQFDNRGCAGWGGSLKKMAQWIKNDTSGNNLDIFDVQWRYYTNHVTTTNTILIPTLNDFSEASVVLATNETTLQSLFSILFFAREWKQNCYYGHDELLLFGFLDWFTMYKEAEFLGRTPNLNATNVMTLLEETGQWISEQNMTNAKQSLNKARESLKELTSLVSTNVLDIQVPSKQIYAVVPPVQDPYANYIINSTTGLFLQMDQPTADLLIKKNFKGFMSFQYQLLDSKFANLITMSSTKRKAKNSLDVGCSRQVITGTIGGSRLHSKYVSNFAEICDIMCNIPGVWQSANVTLYEQNQSWDHSAKNSSDIYFTANANFLVRKILLQFETWERKS